MKISFVNYFSGMCGGNRVLFEVMNGLIDRGHEVKAHAMQPQNWFPLKIPITLAKNPQELQSQVEESDILVATWCETAYIVDSLKGRKGIPAYYCQHHEPIFFADPAQKKMAEDTYDLPLNLISNSPWLEKILKTKHDRDSCMISPGVDSALFHPMRDRSEPENIKTVYKILSFASPTPFKGFYDTTLPTFNYIYRALGPNVEFHVYGGVDLPIPYDWGKNVVRHNGISDEQLCELYNEADLLISGSWAESSPLPHLEAMASGCPVLCTEPGTEHYGDALLRVGPRAQEHGHSGDDAAQDQDLRNRMSLKGIEDARNMPWAKTTCNVEAYFKFLLGEE